MVAKGRKSGKNPPILRYSYTVDLDCCGLTICFLGYNCCVPYVLTGTGAESYLLDVKMMFKVLQNINFFRSYVYDWVMFCYVWYLSVTDTFFIVIVK